MARRDGMYDGQYIQPEPEILAEEELAYNPVLDNNAGGDMVIMRPIDPQIGMIGRRGMMGAGFNEVQKIEYVEDQITGEIVD